MQREHLIGVHPVRELRRVLWIVEPDRVLGAIAQQHARGALPVSQLQLARRIERDDLALAQERDARAELVGLLHVMRGEEDRRALARQLSDERAHLARRRWIE